MNSLSQFTVWQSHLPNKLGISIEEVRLRRDRFLEKGTDWIQQGQRVLFTVPGVEKLLGSLKAPLEGPINAGGLAEFSIKRPAAGAIPASVTAIKTPVDILVIVHRCLKNPRMLEARLGDKIVLVWVPNNLNFIQGMELTVRQNGDRWELAGRCPRFRGRY